MSFEINLWNSVPAIIDHINNKLTGYSSILESFSTHSSLELKKSESLRKLNFINNYLVKEENSLSAFLINMNKFYTKLSDNYRNYAVKMHKEVDDQKKIVDELRRKIKIINRMFDDNEKEYNGALKFLENAKNDFHKKGRITELAILEKAKAEYESKDNDDYKMKAERYRNELKFSENNYQNSILKVNKIRCEYIKNKESFLKQLEECEKCLNSYINETILKLNINMEECYVDCSLENKNLKSKLVNINEEADLMQFITINETQYKIPPINEFCHYNIDCRKNPPKNINSRIIHKTIIEMQNSCLKDENNLYDEIEEEKKILISELSSKVWYEPENFNDEDFNQIKILFREQSFRIYFLEYLNKHRGNGSHNISAICYKKTGILLNLLLDQVYENKDFITAKYCLILSQTYNMMEGDKNKIFLQDAIEKNPLLRNLYFWDEYISYALFEETESSNFKQENSFKETEDEKNNRLGNIYFSQLIHITYNMINFKIPKIEIKKIVLAFSQQNSLAEHFEMQINLLIDEAIYEDYLLIEQREMEKLEMQKEYEQLMQQGKNGSNENSFEENPLKRRSISHSAIDLDFEIIDRNSNENIKNLKNKRYSHNVKMDTTNSINKKNTNSIPNHYIINNLRTEKLRENSDKKSQTHFIKKTSSDNLNLIDNFYYEEKSNKILQRRKSNEIQKDSLENQKNTGEILSIIKEENNLSKNILHENNDQNINLNDYKINNINPNEFINNIDQVYLEEVSKRESAQFINDKFDERLNND